MKRVIGLGGVFFKAKDPKALYEWYHKHLGIECAADGAGIIWQNSDNSEIQFFNILSIFPHDTTYFKPGKSGFMINLRVENLDKLMKALRKEGVEIFGDIEEYGYGKFGWIIDPEGNKIELWEMK